MQKNSQENDEMITECETDEHLKISEATSYELILEGKLPSPKTASHWRLKSGYKKSVFNI